MARPDGGIMHAQVKVGELHRDDERSLGAMSVDGGRTLP